MPMPMPMPTASPMPGLLRASKPDARLRQPGDGARGTRCGGRRIVAALGLIASLMTACATAPDAPRVIALAGAGKRFDQFRADDQHCRQVGREAAKDAGAVSNGAGEPGRSAQDRYDNAFMRCIQAAGHRVSMNGRLHDAANPAPLR